MGDSVLECFRELNIMIKKKLFYIGKSHGITTPPSPLQVKIFMYIYNNKDGEVSQADLVKELHVSKVAISEAISKMVSNGNIAVVTSKIDARKKVLSYTVQGIKKMDEMVKALNELQQELLKDISVCELETFIKVMQHMKNNIGEENYV